MLGDHEITAVSLASRLTDSGRLSIVFATRFTTTDDWQSIAAQFEDTLPSHGLAIAPVGEPEPDFTSLLFLGQSSSYVAFNDFDGAEAWITLQISTIV